jgi:hypothetical protein
MTYVPSFVKIGGGVQAMLRSFLRKMRGRNVGIAGDSDLLMTPLRWDKVP